MDPNGRVVGLNTSGLSRGMALTIPTATIRRVSDALLARGRISRGYIGIGLQPVKLPSTLSGKLGLTQEAGVMVVDVAADGPGAKAGVLLGDILVTLGETAVSDTDQVQRLLEPETVGTQIPVRVIRGGDLRTLPITIGERQ